MKMKLPICVYWMTVLSFLCAISACNNAPDTGSADTGVQSEQQQSGQTESPASGGTYTPLPQGVEFPDIAASDIFGSPEYQAFSFGGFRENTRDVVPTVDQLKEDLKILAAMDIKLLRTYNTQEYPHAANLLEAIRQLRIEDGDFEMYVMLGAWISCEGAFGESPNHDAQDVAHNRAEIDAAVELANMYPESVKAIAVGNEAMVHWAAAYFVKPDIILAWVEHLQQLKSSGELPADVWITSSDNFASWGGGSTDYHNEDLEKLIKAVDFVSMHTYPFHDSHYNPDYWLAPAGEAQLSPEEKAVAAVKRAVEYAQSQFASTTEYVRAIAHEKPVHIGETGWASQSNGFYGTEGSQAADEYKMKLYYDAMRSWTNENNLSCFYFEAFDEPWKDAGNPGGSENHFGMFDISNRAKYALWELVDAGAFEGLTRGGEPVSKTFGGDESAVLGGVLVVPDAQTDN